MDSFLISALVTGLISVSTAVAILRLQEWRNKKRMLKALYSEVEGNFATAEKVLPLVDSFTDKTKKPIGTKSDLQNLHTHSYEDFRRSGYLLSLNEKARQLLEEVYGLIFCHNDQTDRLKNQELEFSSPQALMLSLIPRVGGYKERLEKLIQKLKLSKEELKSYV